MEDHREEFTGREQALLEMKYVALEQADAAAEHLDGKLLSMIQADSFVVASAAIVAAVAASGSGPRGWSWVVLASSVMLTFAFFVATLVTALRAWRPMKFGLLTESVMEDNTDSVSTRVWDETWDLYLLSDAEDAFGQLITNIDYARDRANLAAAAKAKALRQATVLFILQLVFLALALGALLYASV